jgi:TP901 family phage tail tape measure protein
VADENTLEELFVNLLLNDEGLAQAVEASLNRVRQAAATPITIKVTTDTGETKEVATTLTEAAEAASLFGDATTTAVDKASSSLGSFADEIEGRLLRPIAKANDTPIAPKTNPEKVDALLKQISTFGKEVARLKDQAALGEIAPPDLEARLKGIAAGLGDIAGSAGAQQKHIDAVNSVLVQAQNLYRGYENAARRGYEGAEEGARRASQAASDNARVLERAFGAGIGTRLRELQAAISENALALRRGEISVSDYTNAVNPLVVQLEQLRSSFSLTATQSLAASKGIASATKPLEALASAGQKVRGGSGDLISPGVVVNLRGASREAKNLSEAINLLSREQQGLRGRFGATGQDAENVKAQFRALRDEALRLQDAFSGNATAFGRLGAVAHAADRSLAGIEGRMSRLGLASQVNLAFQRELTGQLGRIGPLGDVAALGITSMGGAMAGASAASLTLGAGLIGAGLGIARITRDGTEQVQQLERSFNVINAAAENLDQQVSFDELRSQLRSVQEEGGRAAQSFSRSQLAAALADTVKAGVDAADALTILGTSTQLASAEGENLSESSARLLQNLRQFGLGAENVGVVGDALARAGLLAAGSAADLSKGLATVGPAATAANATLFETLGLLVELDNKGLTAAEIGATGLRNVFASLADPTKEARDLFEQLNISLTDVDGNSRPVIDVLTDLRKALESNGGSFNTLTGEMEGTSEALQIAASVFDTRGVTAILALGDGVEDLTTKITNSQGALRGFSDQLQEGNLAAANRLKAAYQDMAGAAANIVTPFLTDLFTQSAAALQKVAEGLERLDAFLTRNQRNLVDYATAVDSAATLLGEVTTADQLRDALEALGATLTGEAKEAWDAYTQSILENRDAMLDAAGTAEQVATKFPEVAAVEVAQRTRDDPNALQNRLAETSAQLAQAHAEVRRLEDAFVDVGSGQDVADLRAELESVTAEMGRLTLETENFTAEDRLALANLGERRNELVAEINAQNQLTDAAADYTDELNAATAVLETLRRQYNELIALVFNLPAPPAPSLFDPNRASEDAAQAGGQGFFSKVTELLPDARALVDTLKDVTSETERNEIAIYNAEQAYEQFKNQGAEFAEALRLADAAFVPERTERKARDVRTAADVIAEAYAAIANAPKLESLLGDQFDETGYKADALRGAIEELVTKFDFGPASAQVQAFKALLDQLPQSLEDIREQRQRLADAFFAKLVVGVEVGAIDIGVAREHLTNSIQRLEGEIAAFDLSTLGTDDANAQLELLNGLLETATSNLSDLNDKDLGPARMNLAKLSQDAETGRQSFAAINDQLDILARGLSRKLREIEAGGITDLEIKTYLETQDLLTQVGGLQGQIAEAGLDTLVLQVELGFADANAVEALLRGRLDDLRAQIDERADEFGVPLDLDVSNPAALREAIESGIAETPQELRDLVEEYDRLQRVLEGVIGVRREASEAFAENLALGVEVGTIDAETAQQALEAELQRLRDQLSDTLAQVDLTVEGSVDPDLQADIDALTTSIEFLDNLLNTAFGRDIPKPEPVVGTNEANDLRAVNEATAEYARGLALLSYRASVLGEDLDFSGEAAQLLTTILTGLRQRGIDPATEGLDSLEASLNNLQGAATAQQQIADAISGAFARVGAGAQSAVAALPEFVELMANARELAQQVPTELDILTQGLQRFADAGGILGAVATTMLSTLDRMGITAQPILDNADATMRWVAVQRELGNVTRSEAITALEAQRALLLANAPAYADNAEQALAFAEAIAAITGSINELRNPLGSAQSGLVGLLDGISDLGDTSESEFARMKQDVEDYLASLPTDTAARLAPLAERMFGDIDAAELEDFKRQLEEMGHEGEDAFATLERGMRLAAETNPILAAGLQGLLDILSALEQKEFDLGLQSLDLDILETFNRELERIGGVSRGPFDGLKQQVYESLRAIGLLPEEVDKLNDRLALINELELDVGIADLQNQLSNIAGGAPTQLELLRERLDALAASEVKTAEDAALIKDAYADLELLEAAGQFDALADSLSGLGGSISGELGRFATTVAKIFDPAIQSVTVFEIEAGQALSAVISGVGNLLEVAAQDAPEIADYIKGIGAAFSESENEALSALGGIASGIGGLAEGVATQNPVGMVSGVVGIISGIIELFDAAGAELREQARELGEGIESELSDSIINGFDDFGDDTRLIVAQALVEAFRMSPEVVAQIAELVRLIQAALQDKLIDGAEQAAIDAGFAALQAMGEAFRSQISPLLPPPEIDTEVDVTYTSDDPPWEDPAFLDFGDSVLAAAEVLSDSSAAMERAAEDFAFDMSATPFIPTDSPTITTTQTMRDFREAVEIFRATADKGVSVTVRNTKANGAPISTAKYRLVR